MPVNQDFANLLAERQEFYISRQNYEIEDYFNKDTRENIAKFWRVLFQNEISYEMLRKELATQNYGFTLRGLFQQIDSNLDGFFNFNDLKAFIEKNGAFNASHTDIRGLLLKMGGYKNNRGKKDLNIGFVDFSEEFQVKLPQK